MAESSNPANTQAKTALKMASKSKFLNRLLDGVSPVPTARKPFDALIEGLYSEQSRGDRTRFELFVEGIRLWESEKRLLLGEEL
jgi:hypothetical protein